MSINGTDRKEIKDYRKMLCYIKQEDNHMTQLTVREAMTVAANLKLGPEISKRGKSLIVSTVMILLV